MDIRRDGEWRAVWGRLVTEPGFAEKTHGAKVRAVEERRNRGRWEGAEQGFVALGRTDRIAHTDPPAEVDREDWVETGAVAARLDPCRKWRQTLR